MKNKLIYLGALLVLVFCTALVFYTETGTEKKASPSIDFSALSVDSEEGSAHSEVLLRMSLQDYQGDILNYGSPTPEQHQERLMHFISDFKNDIFLVTESDTIPCLDSHFERTYMDSPFRNFILNFATDHVDTEDRLMIIDRVYSGEILAVNIDQGL